MNRRESLFYERVGLPYLLHQLLRRKPVNISSHEDFDGNSFELPRSLSTISVAALGIASTMGTGIFFILGEAVPMAGPAIIISFIVAGIAAGLSALCYAELASTCPNAGSAYYYAYSTLGEFMAAVVGACLVLEYAVSTAAVAVGWSSYINRLLQYARFPSVPQWLSGSPWDQIAGVINLPAVILVIICAVLLCYRVSESARVNLILVITKIVILSLFIITCFTAFSASHLTPFAPYGIFGISMGASQIFFSFIGLDSIATSSEEIKDPKKGIPRAILLALMVVLVVYILVAIAAVGSQSSDKFNPKQNLAGILDDVTKASWPSFILTIGAVISVFSVTLVTLYSQSRVFFSMSRDSMIPSFFGEINSRTNAPVKAIVFTAIIVALLAAFVPLADLAGMVSIGTLVAFIIVSLAVIILRKRESQLPRGFSVPLYPITPILAIISCLFVLWGISVNTWIAFGIWICCGVAFYLLWGRRNSYLQKVEDLAGIVQ